MDTEYKIGDKVLITGDMPTFGHIGYIKDIRPHNLYPLSIHIKSIGIASAYGLFEVSLVIGEVYYLMENQSE